MFGLYKYKKRKIVNSMERVCSSTNDKILNDNSFQEYIPLKIVKVETLKCSKEDNAAMKNLNRKCKKRPLVKCPDCQTLIRSNNIKTHRERHIKKLTTVKRHKCSFPNCNFSSNRKSVITSHGKVHDVAHRLAKIERKKQKKRISTAVKANAEQQPEETTDEHYTQTTQTNLNVTKHQEQSTQTEVIGTEAEVVLRDITTKIKVMTEVLQMHYNLLADACPDQFSTFDKIFEEMTKPLVEIFRSLKSWLDTHTDHAASHAIDVALDFQKMVEEMTRKKKNLHRPHEVH